MTDESGTVALVTGAAHGIGLEVSRQLAERGWTVVGDSLRIDGWSGWVLVAPRWGLSSG